MPNIISNSAFTVPTIMTVLKDDGVERGVIMQGLSDDALPDTVSAVQLHGDVFWGAMRLDPHADNLAERAKYYHAMGLTVVKILMLQKGPYWAYKDNRINSKAHREVWELAEEWGLTVAVDSGAPGTLGYGVNEIEDVVKDYPGLRFVICHMGQPQMHWQEGQEDDWKRMRQLGGYPNVWFECSSLSTFFIEEAYPFPSAQKVVRDFIDEFGKEKVLWGSDMPGTLCDGTYRQLIDTYERSTLLTEEEKDLLFYDNAMKAYGKR